MKFFKNYLPIAAALLLSVGAIALSAWNQGHQNLVGVQAAASHEAAAPGANVPLDRSSAARGWLMELLGFASIGALLTAPFDAPLRDGEFVSIPVEANTQLYSGGIIAKDANGYAVAANDAPGLTVMGRCEEGVNNNAEQWNNYLNGPAGYINVRVRRGVFAYANSVADPVAIADVGNVVYIESDSVINKTGGVNKIAAGRLIGIDPVTGAVWVDFKDKAVTVA